MSTPPSLYRRHRFPPQIISHGVWLYFRFALSYRDVEEIMAVRGVTLTYETVREWCLKFGQTYANGLRRKRPHPGDRWHLDEVFIRINGRVHYLWRAVDQDGEVLDILVQSRRNKKAAKRFLRQVAEGFAVRAESDRYGSAQELPRGEGSGSCRVSSTSRRRGATTVLRTHTNRLESEKK